MICQFYTEKDAFEAVARPILTKPKPKVEPPKDEKAKDNKKASPKDSNKTSGSAADAEQSKDEPMEDSSATAVNGNGSSKDPAMDLD